jgi:phosphohistidine phosphatase SixA
MFVGHEPDFSTTIASLVGGRVAMKKGGLARVDIISSQPQPLLGELVWLIAPKVFERLK